MEMTKEEKELLIKDLCGRLPYGVKVRYMSVGEAMPQVWDLIGMPTAEHCDILVPYERRFSAVSIQDIKPYLRQMSSMTDEELYEWTHTWIMDTTAEKYDWLNIHHFDYRGLIEKGLALQAPEGMYKIPDNTIGNVFN
jgi:alpha-L-arabinofuranosidase